MYKVKELLDGQVVKRRYYLSEDTYKKYASTQHIVYTTLHYKLIDGKYQLVYVSLPSEEEYLLRALASNSNHMQELTQFLAKG